MIYFHENSCKLFSSSSSEESRDSMGALKSEAGIRDEEFYEEIEAPKFVDFTAPDHCRPDDRYWFCLRVGCDQKHLEEIDSEKIYKDFVLRVMAARSPNVRLRKVLDRNASRTPTKCPHSAPPKSIRSRLSRLANISSISEKMVDNKRSVVRSLLKPGSTPVVKTKPVASKYLTTPRNKKCLPNQNSFRSVQNMKPTNSDVSESRMVAKALIFHSPKKAAKIKTSVELRTPITKLCEGMNKLRISSQKKGALGSFNKSAKKLESSTSRGQLTGSKEQSSKLLRSQTSRGQLTGSKEQSSRPLCSQTSINNEVKQVRASNSKVKGKVAKQVLSMKASGVDRVDRLKTKSGDEIKQHSFTEEVAEELKTEGSGQEATLNGPDLTSSDDSEGEGKLSELKASDCLKSRTTSPEENSGNDSTEQNKRMNFTSESSGNANVNNISEGQTGNNEFMDSDDKENVAASDANRMKESNQKQNGRNMLGNMQGKCAQVKKISQAPDKHLKEGPVSSGPALMKIKKPKPTNPKPFRLRTDERGILKEASLEKRAQSAQSENDSRSNHFGKFQRKQEPDIQKGSAVASQKVLLPIGLDKPKAAVYTSQTCKEPKISNSCNKSKAIQRLEKFRRTVSPVQKQTAQPQRPVPSKKELISFLIPGQKLDVIPETSPEVSEIKKTGKAAATDVVESNFYSTHVQRSCSKKLIN